MTVLNFETLVAGTIWLALGVTIYVLYRRHQGLSLTETHKVVLPKPAVEHEVEYESVLVAFEDGALLARGRDHRGEAGGSAPARDPRAGHDHRAAERPRSTPTMPEQEARAASVIDSARVLGGRRVTGHWEKVRPGQAGRRIVEEAKETRARADRDVSPSAARGGVAVREDARNGLGGAPLPRHHRLLAGAEG